MASGIKTGFSVVLAAFTVLHQPVAHAVVFIDSNLVLGRVNMVQLVEAPINHLTGSIVTNQVSSDDSIEQRTYNLTGSIEGSSVALRETNGLPGWLSSKSNLIGQLSDGQLTLSFGPDSEMFEQSSQNQYLTDVQELQMLVRLKKICIDNAHQLISDGESQKEINNRLTNYMKWGQARIKHSATTNDRYTRNINEFEECLNQINLDKTNHVPRWDWNQCHYSLDNAKFAIDQNNHEIHALRKINRKAIAKFNEEIPAVIQRYEIDLISLKTHTQALCDYENQIGITHIESCAIWTNQVTATIPPVAPLNEALVEEYKTYQGQVTDAVNAEVSESDTGTAQLKMIRKEVLALTR